MTTLDRLWEAVERSPKDWQRYLVLADALNDAGQTRLERTVRWMVREGKAPEYTDWLYGSSTAVRWCWYDISKVEREGPEKLTAELFVGHPCGAKCSRSLFAAIRWLLDQLERTGMI